MFGLISKWFMYLGVLGCLIILGTIFPLLSIMLIVLLAIIIKVVIDYNRWNNTYYVCENCGRECKASETFTNMLDKKRNWKCYYCNEYNYNFKKICK